MSTTTRDGRLPKRLMVGSIAVGLAAGSYGLAGAASNDSGPSPSTSSGGTTTQPASPAPPGHGGAGGSPPWGGQRSDETPLTGETASKVEAAAKAEVPGGAIVRVETDADGHTAYEAHTTDADGIPVTVYVDEQFEVVSVERR
jgi:hypothetical protein